MVTYVRVDSFGARHERREVAVTTTIKQVARAAGVSPTTVSHVLNGRGRVAAETRSWILQVVEELGYRSNRHAQQLVTRRSRILAIQLPDIGESGQGAVPHSGYFLDIINGASTAADDLGYALIVIPARSAGSGNSLGDFAVDGAVLVDPEGTEAAFDVPIPLATVGVPLESTRPVASVDNDHDAIVRKLFNHFASLGCSRPMLVTDRTRRSYIRDLTLSYRQQMNARGAEPIVHSLASLTRVSLDRVVTAALRHRIDSVVAASDDIALGVHSAARRHGLHVPEEFLLASVVNAPSLTLTSPQITATNMYPRRAGVTAIQLLVDRIENTDGVDPQETKTLIPNRLIIRGSTRAERVNPA